MTAVERWAQLGPVSNVFTREQMQRAQAVRIAREVIETRASSKGPLSPGGTEVNLAYLIEVAQWIIDGEDPEMARRMIDQQFPEVVS